MKVCLLTCTKNRNKHIKRLVRFILDQSYTDFVHVIYNNSSVDIRLNENLPKDKFILVNNSKSLSTGKSYTTLGEIYNDAIKFIPKDAKLVNFTDDDDIYLEDHVQEGVNGYLRGGVKAYKPRLSWFKQRNSIQLAENVLEPSIFVEVEHVKKYGFGLESVAQHHQWLNPLIISQEIFVDDGKPTYICDWSGELATFKTSGNPRSIDNFKNYEINSQDLGDKIITPCSKTWADHYRKIK